MKINLVYIKQHLKKIIIFIVILVAIVFGYFFYQTKQKVILPQKQILTVEKKQNEKLYFEFKAIQNLKLQDKEKHVVNLKIAFEFWDQDTKKKLDEYWFEIYDVIVFRLRRKYSYELLSVEDKIAFKKEIFSDLNKFFGTRTKYNIYFVNFVIYNQF